MYRNGIYLLSNTLCWSGREKAFSFRVLTEVQDSGNERYSLRYDSAASSRGPGALTWSAWWIAGSLSYLYHIFISLNDDCHMGKSRPRPSFILLPVSSSTLPSLPYSGRGQPSHSLINSVVLYSYGPEVPCATPQLLWVLSGPHHSDPLLGIREFTGPFPQIFLMPQLRRKMVIYSFSLWQQWCFFFTNHRRASKPITNSFIFIIFFISFNIVYFTWAI